MRVTLVRLPIPLFNRLKLEFNQAKEPFIMNADDGQGHTRTYQLVADKRERRGEVKRPVCM